MLEDKQLDALKQRFEKRRRRFSESSAMDLKQHQLYVPRELMEPQDILAARPALIDKFVPIASMGSCFAREVRNYLVGKGFNYLCEGTGRAAEHGSARWERVYNTSCILQEIQRAFGHFEGDLFEAEDGTVVDPHRKAMKFSSADEAKTDITLYTCEARKVLENAKVFIVTLGLSETWRNRFNGKTYAEFPPKGFDDPNRDEFRLLSPDENTENLRRAISLLKEKNRDLQIILTVSPIPIRLTYLPRNARISNAVSKASLLWAASQIVEEFDHVHYFPSYEIVTDLTDPFDWDHRHVTPETVEKVMAVFEYGFIQ